MTPDRWFLRLTVTRTDEPMRLIFPSMTKGDFPAFRSRGDTTVTAFSAPNAATISCPTRFGSPRGMSAEARPNCPTATFGSILPEPADMREKRTALAASTTIAAPPAVQRHDPYLRGSDAVAGAAP